MTDAFDDFLAQALDPAGREPDRAFVARVQARIRLEERIALERRSLLSGLAVQVLGIGVIAAALWWLSRSPAIASFASESPAVLLVALLAAFSFVIVLFASRPGSGTSRNDMKSGFSTT
ncbi:MAG: hypothetical protein HOP96_11495 [Sphingomonas sp.]|nr:hypothetical protein [Sphingomonas sp.]